MREPSTRKTVTKQSKDLRDAPMVGLKSSVTVTKKSSLKESILPRTSHKYTELPSLRYGATPNQTAFQMRNSGPLRLSLRYESSYVKMKTAENLNGNPSTPAGDNKNPIKNSLENYNGDAPPVRRVHFAELPPKSNSLVDFRELKEKNAERGEEKEETENWMKNRIGISCIDGNSVSSLRFARHGLTSAAKFNSRDKIDVERLGNGVDDGRGTTFSNFDLKLSVRGHETAKYRNGTLNQYSPSRLPAILQAVKDGNDKEVAELLKKASIFGISPEELNATDATGRTALSYIASNGTMANLKVILQLPKIDVNKQDNEGNTPLHFASQAGQVEAINYMLSICPNLEVDARNALGFTPLMKAALQGWTKCAKLLLFAGASPTLRDSGRGLRAEQWAKFCGRYVCAEVIEKFTRQKNLDRNTPLGKWKSEPELAARINPTKSQVSNPSSSSIKSKLRKAFRTISHPGQENCGKPYSVVSQLTSAALCASTPVLQSSMSPSVKSLMRPLSVPKVQVTLASNCTTGDSSDSALQHSPSTTYNKEKSGSNISSKK